MRRPDHIQLDVARARLESRLRREGLAPLPPKNALPSKFRSMTSEQIEAHVAVVDRWQRWAFEVLEEFPFANAHQRRIWELYAQGRPWREIAAKVHSGSRGRLIARVKAHYPDRPTNPWSRSLVAEAEADDAPPAPAPVRTFTAAERAALQAQILNTRRTK